MRIRAICRAGLSGFCAMLILLPPTASAQDVDIAADAVQYDLSATSLAQHCVTVLHRSEATLQRILARSPRLATFANIVVPLESTIADTNDALLADQFLGSVSSDQATRAASDTCQTEFAHLLSRTESRPELARLLHDAALHGLPESEADRKLLELWQATVDRAGANLTGTAHERYLETTRRLEDLQSAFMANLANRSATLTLSRDRLDGLPADFIDAARHNGDGTYTFAVDESTDQRFLRNARREDTRRAFYEAYANRGYPENEPILREILSLRLRLANLLGYPDWASYVLADRMAKTPERVRQFLDGLDQALLPVAVRDASKLTELKARDLGRTDVEFHIWDLAYYDEQLRRTRYAIDTNVVRRYFPVDHVVDAVLSIYAGILHVEFGEVRPAHAWAEGVRQFAVRDARDGRMLGTLYLDLFPRPGKYTHFASFPILPVRFRSDGSRRPPIDAIVGNWARASGDGPATLTHDEVQTFFHEFGHAMAALLTTAPYETLSQGFRADFVEAPSQMLENFVWEPTILQRLSAEIGTGRPMPDALIAKIIAARHVDDALFNTQQICYADVDLAFHGRDLGVDPAKRWRAVARRTTPLVPSETSHPADSFSHLVAGYDAGYYGYLWSRVYAQDLYTKFESAQPGGVDVGLLYRRTILEPARMREPDVEVSDFLGRPASPQAFYRDLGIRSSVLRLP